MTRQPTTDELKPFFNQLHQLESSVLTGSRRLEDVRPALQRLIEGKFHINGTATGFPNWYVSPEQQWANVLIWNEERHWGFTETDFPEVPKGLVLNSPLCVPVLAVYLPDKDGIPGYVRTASELWGIANRFQSNSWQWVDFHLDADHLRLLEGTEEAHTPGIRWVMVDLGAHWNGKDYVRPCDVRGKDSAHAEILAAAAHFPDWVRSMNGTNVPYVWLPGYQTTVPGREPWACMPVLDWILFYSGVFLGARWDDNRFQNYAVPVRREL